MTKIKKKTQIIVPLRRSQRKKKFRFQLHELGLATTRKHGKVNALTLTDLPTEIIFEIFSYLPNMELYNNVRLTCSKLRKLSMEPHLWKRLYIDGKLVISQVEYLIINSGEVCEGLSISNRNDANIILDSVSKYMKNIKSIEIINCQGSPKTLNIKSNYLCSLIKRCKKLQKFTMVKSRFISCKFFKLLAKKVSCQKTNNLNKIKFVYEGPLDCKQMRVFFAAVKDGVLQISKSSFTVHERNGVLEWSDEEYDDIEDDPNYEVNGIELNDESDADDDVRYDFAQDFDAQNEVQMQID